MFETGWGDGLYPTWFGLDRAGDVIVAMTDFLLDNARPALTWTTGSLHGRRCRRVQRSGSGGALTQNHLIGKGGRLRPQNAPYGIC